MSLVLNTNMNSLTAQQNLSSSQMKLSTAMSRLSSGLRINSAADDAAGMAIATRMTTQVNGLTQASRNANDGISLAQTAEGALTELTNNLQAIRELAVQSANGTNSSSDRAALDKEVQQRLAEIDRIATQTTFNGQHVLDGTFGSATFQVGANVGETIGIGLNSSMRTSSLGRLADYASGTAYNSSLAVGQQGAGVSANALGAGAMVVQVGTGPSTTIGASVAGNTALGQSATSAYSKAAAINSANVSGLTATADTTAQVKWTDIASGSGYSLTVNGTTIYSTSNAVITGNDVVSQINANTGATGVTASYDSTNGVVTLNNANGGDIAVSQTAHTTVGTGFGSAATATGVVNNTANQANVLTTGTVDTAVTKTFVGSIHLTANDSITLSGGGTGGVAAAGFTAQSYALGNNALNSSNVTSVTNANTTINAIDAALKAVSDLESTLGAIQNRFQSAINSTNATNQNLTAARSRIQDADFAAETSNMTSANILQQAGVSVLAQANSSQQSILKLLQ
jgi:flagellin